MCITCDTFKSNSSAQLRSHSETLCPAMKTLYLLLPLAFALPAQDQLVQLESNEDFVIGSSCTIEAIDEDGNLDEASLDKCGDCFEKADTLEAAKACTIEHLPNFYEECKIWIESPTAPLEDVLQCFIEVVKFFDSDGEARQGVKDFLGL